MYIFKIQLEALWTKRVMKQYWAYFWATVTSNGSTYAMGPLSCLSCLSVCNVDVGPIVAKRLDGSRRHLVWR